MRGKQQNQYYHVFTKNPPAGPSSPLPCSLPPTRPHLSCCEGAVHPLVCPVIADVGRGRSWPAVVRRLLGHTQSAGEEDGARSCQCQAHLLERRRAWDEEGLCLQHSKGVVAVSHASGRGGSRGGMFVRVHGRSLSLGSLSILSPCPGAITGQSPPSGSSCRRGAWGMLPLAALHLLGSWGLSGWYGEG